VCASVALCILTPRLAAPVPLRPVGHHREELRKRTVESLVVVHDDLSLPPQGLQPAERLIAPGGGAARKGQHQPAESEVAAQSVY
jgi:hypothetical protein